MLFELLEDKLEAIGALDVEADAVALSEQILVHNPGPFRTIPPPVSAALAGGGEAAGAVDHMGALLLAQAGLRLIKEIPDHANEMRTLVLGGHAAPHVRAALLGALAYLVQPAELVHDDAPGGYGYIDDCIVLKTMRLAMARMGVPVMMDQGRELRALSLLALALAPGDFAKMQNLVTRTWNEIHLLHMLPPHVAAQHAQRIQQCPLDIPYDWSTPMTPFTSISPTLSPGSFGTANPEGITIDFASGGMVHMTPSGDIFGYD